MLTRRALLEGALATLVFPACKRSASPSWPRHRTYEGVEIVELFPHDADESSPLVVAIHGRGGEPESFGSIFEGFGGRAQIALPRGFDRHGNGWSWFEFRDEMTDDDFGAELGRSEARLWRGIAALAKGRRPIVTGFSQGGFLSFAMASRHPDEILRALPAGASCPGPLLPKNHARTAPVVAFHGTADDVVQIKWGRAAVNAFKDQGADAVLREYPVGHSLAGAMRADLLAEIEKALPPRR
jgi:phospholipase/carboxylesterase